MICSTKVDNEFTSKGNDGNSLVEQQFITQKKVLFRVTALRTYVDGSSKMKLYTTFRNLKISTDVKVHYCLNIYFVHFLLLFHAVIMLY